jgi:hypothetical protein
MVVTAISTSHQSLRCITSATTTYLGLTGVQRRHRIYLFSERDAARRQW